MRGGAGGALLEACDIASNGGSGVLARDGARARVLACSIRGNAGFGVLLKDGAGEFAGNTIAGGPGALSRGVLLGQSLCL